ncbi:heavy metal-associated isoprenylated plant protein 5-like [Ananas comosus]|uniref:Heavy metal-associated isoprenylated plant protein 5-like n=2 Tax=Ananas comosus TaxID=4615 RepID=A0A6P5EYS8_ANACO|nr:heavy metal-associated isoprenylated plant protein 5-like [Ananas comosus]
MAQELERARVTELHVRMDCNGCVQKIKKALHNIEGVYDVYIDFAQQKITVVGRANPEAIVKAIKKTKKIATVCSHTELPDPAAGKSEQPPPDAAKEQAPPASEPPAETPPASDPPKEPPKEEQKAEPEVKPSPEAEAATPAEVKEVGEIHMVHQYPHGYSGFQHELTPHVFVHSYNSYRPSAYASEYGYLRSPPRDIKYNGGSYGDEHRHYGNGDGSQITSMFTDENPNACRIS